jgi:hypothetical protein
VAAHRGFTSGLKQQLDVRQLRVDALQLGCPPDQHVEFDVVAARHLVEETAELGLHDRELLSQTITLDDQIQRPVLWS